MGCRKLQGSVWSLTRRQHGVVTRGQLLGLGYGREAINHRIRSGRLHRVHRGVYLVGRPELSQRGRWMAAVLACGPGAALSDDDAAALWGIRPQTDGPVHISVPARARLRRPGIVVHRRENLDRTAREGIPVTTPAATLIDLASRLEHGPLERAINEADRLDLIDPESLRATLAGRAGAPGMRRLREILDHETFVLTDSELERRFLPIARRAGLPKPDSGRTLNGFKVDFHWPDLGLVVETDGLRYHRTPAQQARDRRRDHAHAVAGLTSLRFTHGQVRFDAGHVEATLRAVARRLQSGNLPRHAY